MVSISGINDRNSMCNAEFKVVKIKKNEIKRKKKLTAKSIVNGVM